MAALEYEYSAENRLDHPHKYMYTKYGGIDFLRTYFSSRRMIMQKMHELSAALPENKELQGVLRDYSQFLKWKGILVPVQSSSIVLPVDYPPEHLQKLCERDFLLSELMKILLSLSLRFADLERHEQERLYGSLSIFIKKFEVFKRLYSRYTPDFKKLDEDYRSLLNYLLFSAALLAYHSQTANLKFLNCALKVNDLLCSIAYDVKSREEALLLCDVLQLEEQAIGNLLRQKGVDNG